MATLTKSEILDQLKRLGLDTFYELTMYLYDYRKYYNSCNIRSSSASESNK